MLHASTGACLRFFILMRLCHQSNSASQNRTAECASLIIKISSLHVQYVWINSVDWIKHQRSSVREATAQKPNSPKWTHVLLIMRSWTFFGYLLSFKRKKVTKHLLIENYFSCSFRLIEKNQKIKDDMNAPRIRPGCASLCVTCVIDSWVVKVCIIT